MRLCSASLWMQVRSWFRDYDNVQRLAVLLLYIQIACSLIGSIGALYIGELVVNLLVALFALVAIESGSQILGRTYALLLACTIFLDIAWFSLFSNEIRCIDTKKYGKHSIFSVRIVFWMQIIGFSVRFLSSFVWFQMYRLGVSSDHVPLHQPLDIDSRTNLFTPVSRSPARQISISDEVLGGSIYNPAYYSTLFQGKEDSGHTNETADMLELPGTETPPKVTHGSAIP